VSDDIMNVGEENDLPYMPDDILWRVDDVIYNAVVAGDPRIATQFSLQLGQGIRMCGIALAKLFWELQDKWNTFVQAGIDDTYEDFIESETAYSSVTVKKYAEMWKAIFLNPDISDEIKDRLMGKPIKSLLLLTAGARGGDFGEDEWLDIIQSSSSAEVRDIVRGVRGSQTSSENAVLIQLDIRTGQLSARKGSNGFFEPFGILALDKVKTSEAVATAVERIVRDARIMEI